MKRIKFSKIVYLFIGGLISVFGFQNCSQPVDSASNNIQNEGSAVRTPSLLPQIIDENCLMGNGSACLFSKNAVSQQGQPVRHLRAVDIEKFQILSVDLAIFTTNSQLKNSSFITLKSGVNDPLGPISSGNWRYKMSDVDGESKVGQLMSFYWSNYALENSLNSTGIFYAKDKKIKIITDSSGSSGWAPEKNQIHLSISSAGGRSSLDGGAAVYFLGLANLDYATNGAISVRSKDTHQNCNGVASGTASVDCCKTRTGCSRAIASGQADYFVAMTFPNSPTIGEGIRDNIEGGYFCRDSVMHRNPEQNLNRTVDEAFNNCRVDEQTGSIYSMGALYASIWWSVRKSAVSAAEVDRLFMMHLQMLDGDDDFISVQKIILDLDRNHFGSKYKTAFENEFRLRRLRN